ncbi:hypothetical protein F5I97DRAFT_243315 [Phlebopus sp. FC_14]|nr:hypothetical protein F5I97DRAFT_243315 [Phlebopus sp. FC_14]
MLASLKTLVVVVAAAVTVVQAQSGTSSAPASTSSLPAGIDDCILTCVTQAAASGGCSSFTDLQCVCTSTAFQSAALQCLQSTCTPADVTAATQLQQQECVGISGSSAASGTPTGSATGSASATGSSPTPTAPSTASTPSTSASGSSTPSPSTGAAAALVVPFSLGGVIGTFVASAGAIVGATFVL